MMDIEKMKKYVSDLRREREGITRRRIDLDKEYKRQGDGLDAELERLQERCPHVDTKHHPDVSGNNGSWESCNICGKEAKRL